MQNKITFLAGFIVLILTGSISDLHASGNVPPETLQNNQSIGNCLPENRTRTEVIKLNYVKAEDVARVLDHLYSDRARIIPFKPGNSLVIQYRHRVCKDLE